MRRSTLALAIVLLGAGLRAALALNAEDNMTAWASASASERSSVVDEIMSKAATSGHVSRSEILACLNEAAGVSGHEQLPIGEIAQACAHPSELGDQGKENIGL